MQDLTPALAQSFGLDHPRGALVVDVAPDGPGAHAGLERGDVIIEYNGTAIEDSHQVPALVAETKVGEIAQVKVLRNGHEQTLTLIIAEQPSERSARAERPPTGRDWGLSLTDLTPALARRFGIPPGVRGAMVREVADGSPADEAGIEVGDVIRQVGPAAGDLGARLPASARSRRRPGPPADPARPQCRLQRPVALDRRSLRPAGLWPASFYGPLPVGSLQTTK